MTSIKNNIGITIAGLFLLFGLGYSYYTPLWCPPDEERHFAYCEYIAQNHKLPYLKANDAWFRIGQAVHPPLYYLIGSLFCKDDKELILQKVLINEGPGYTIISPPYNKDDPSYSRKALSAYLLRFLSLVFSGLTVYLTFRIILNIFPDETLLASTGALLIATNPQFLHSSASVSNDPLNIAFVTLYVLILINYLKSPFKFFQQILVGAVLGCCLLTKLPSIIYIPVTVITVLWCCFREKRNGIGNLFVIFLIASSISGWWYLRNWLFYHDPIFRKAQDAIYPGSLRNTPFSLSEGLLLLKMTFVSFWGFFGSLQIPIATIHLVFYGTFLILSSVGILRIIVKKNLTTFQAQALTLLFISVCVGIAFYLNLNIKYNAVMGRYLFIVIAPIAVLMAVGLRMILPGRLKRYLLILVGCLLVVVNLDVFFRVLKPAYSETLLVAGVDQPQFCCPTPALNSSTTIGQTFVSLKNNLCAVRVMFSNEGQQPHGKVRFTLQEADTHHKVLCQIIVPAGKIEELNKYYFIFPPIPNSQGRRYQFSFDTQSMDQHNGNSLWYEANNCYHEGNLLINGNPVSGALYFTTYHFTGEHPATEWQGKRETVINQGWYFNFREMQYYAELSSDFKVKTTTHEKMLRLDKALENRKINAHNSNR